MRDRVAELFGLPPEAPHLDSALTHPSYANERRGIDDNQRLEFLGDAVLGFCTSELLYARFPAADEGTLTRVRARIVSAEALADWGRKNGIAEALRLGRGADLSGLRESTNVLADAVEALIAATFLDVGLDAVRRICARIVEEQLVSIEVAGARDPKSELQERIQATRSEAPTYQVIESGGPAHARWFAVTVRVGSQILGEGRGRSKRLAERAAAAAALVRLAEAPSVPPPALSNAKEES